MGAPLSSAGPQVRDGYPMWGLNPLLPRETSIMPVMSLQLLSHRVRDMGPNQTMLLPLLFFSMWFFLYIFSCRRAILFVFRLFSEGHSIHSWNLGVSMGGSEVRILLLHHLNEDSRLSYLLTFKIIFDL